MNATRTLHTTLVLSTLLCITAGGCVSASYGPSIPIPIPVSPWLQEKEEDQAWERERYDRVPILGPLTQGGPAVALDAPTDDEVIRALEKARPVERSVPFLWTRQRNDVKIVKEKISDYVDPPRVYPMIGPAQQHHAHYKCTIYFEEVTRNGWPVPYTVRDDTVEVIYIDHNHLHMVGIEP
ncbi:MAG: hypothetical protein MK179_19140 [Pirellulaceae bacterium]|nr:hypothetical protein [Pirellulaceae bacterium]